MQIQETDSKKQGANKKVIALSLTAAIFAITSVVLLILLLVL